MRLDVFLVKKGLVKTRERAKEAIIHGAVFVNDIKITKPSKNVTTDARVCVKQDVFSLYVSRAAYKLLGAIEIWKINFDKKSVLDIGASTGGFTQVALEFGARHVYAVDVGKEQLADELKNDARVISLRDLMRVN